MIKQLTSGSNSQLKKLLLQRVTIINRGWNTLRGILKKNKSEYYVHDLDLDERVEFPNNSVLKIDGNIIRLDSDAIKNAIIDSGEGLMKRQNPKSEIFKAVSRSSKLPIYQAYMGFNTPIWRGNAENEKDACARAYADTGTPAIFAKLWEKAVQNPKCKTIEVRRKIRILGKPRVVKVKRKICNPELDLTRLENSLVHELIEYDKKLTAKDKNIYRMGHYLKAVDKAFGDLKQIDNPTLEDVKASVSQRFDPQLPPVKKFLKKHT